MAEYLTTDTELTAIANAIRAKGGTSGTLSYPNGFVSAIGDIQTGGGGNDVIFYDDLAANKIYASYTAAEFAELTEMPANPDHSNYVTHGISIPMTSQGWNWSLADAKTYVAAYGKLNIAQMYVPTDGKTHYVCYVPEGAPSSIWDTEIGIHGNITWQVDNGTTETGNSIITIPFSSTGWHDVKVEGEGYYPYYSSASKSGQSKLVKIRDVYIGSHVSKIGSNAFSYCYSLTSVTIPYGVTSIEGSAFSSCKSLINVTIPAGVTSIVSSAFYYCFSLTSVTLSSGVTSIGMNAFNYCYTLRNITIPSSVTSIGSSAFSGCRLASITIPSSVTSIGSSAFNNCYALTSITIPSGATSIGSSTFSGCSSLTNVTIPSGVTSIGSNAFQTCYSLASITIPSGVTSIGSSAFSGCSSLTNVTIPSDVTSIGKNAFNSCTVLTSITIPSSVTSIEESMFYGCHTLTNITIPADVTSIGNSAFQTCYSLASITMLSSTPPTLGNSVFLDLPINYVITVPAGSRETYIADTNWSSLADHIVEAAE